MSYAARARQLGYVPVLGKHSGRWMKPTDATQVIQDHVMRRWACSVEFKYKKATDAEAAMEAAAEELLKDADSHQ